MSVAQRLDKVCEIAMGQAPNGDAYNFDGKGWPLIAGAGDFGKFYPVAKKFTTEATRLSKHGDIVLGIRATIGEKVTADGEYCLGRGVAGLRPKPPLNSRYLWHWLTNIRPVLASKAKGATFKQVNKEDVGGLRISLPPLPEQRRISTILDQADALRAKSREALAQMDSLTQSIFIEMFGDPITNPRGWKWETLGNFFHFLTGKLDSNAAVENGAYPFFTCAREDYRIDTFAFDCEALLLAGNNASADYSVKHYKGKFNAYQRTYVITLKNPSNSYKFAAFVLENHLTELKRLSKGSSTKYLTLELLKRIRIPVPPVSLQGQFSSRMSSVNKIRSTLLASHSKFDTLFASLQHRAFRGEL